MAVSRFVDEHPGMAAGRQKSLAFPFPFKPLPEVLRWNSFSGERPFISSIPQRIAAGADSGHRFSARGEVSC